MLGDNQLAAPLGPSQWQGSEASALGMYVCKEPRRNLPFFWAGAAMPLGPKVTELFSFPAFYMLHTCT